MKRRVLFGGLALFVFPVFMLAHFFYVSAPDGDDYGMTKQYMGLPPCEVILGNKFTEIAPPKGFDWCKTEGMVGIEQIPDGPVQMSHIQGRPIRMGTLAPGESKTFRLFAPKNRPGR